MFFSIFSKLVPIPLSSFDQWLQAKQKNERALKRLIKKMQKNEDDENAELRHKRNMTFEDWM